MCSIKRSGHVFILTLTGDGEHRLSLDLIARIRYALGCVRTESATSPFSALVTRAEGKYFTSGFDLTFAKSAETPLLQWERENSLMDGLISITSDLMSLKVPTICVVTGDSSAAGFMLAFSHDYVAMPRDNGFLCTSELSTLQGQHYFTSLMWEKVGDLEVFKDLVLHDKKIPAMEAMNKGVVDFVGNTTQETVEVAINFGQMLARKNWNGGVYASMRKGAFPEICRVVGLADENDDDW